LVGREAACKEPYRPFSFYTTDEFCPTADFLPVNGALHLWAFHREGKKAEGATLHMAFHAPSPPKSTIAFGWPGVGLPAGGLIDGGL
jgi:hypothetical protein